MHWKRRRCYQAERQRRSENYEFSHGFPPISSPWPLDDLSQFGNNEVYEKFAAFSRKFTFCLLLAKLVGIQGPQTPTRRE
jgi:hypothetical protein